MAAKQREDTEVVVKEYERECTKLISVSYCCHGDVTGLYVTKAHTHAHAHTCTHTQDLDTTDGRLRAVLEEQQRLQKQVDGYLRELTQRMERIQRLEVTRDDLLEQVSHQQLQLKQNRSDIQLEVRQREELEAAKKLLERKIADQKAEIGDLKSQICRLQQESMVGVVNCMWDRPSDVSHRWSSP